MIFNPFKPNGISLYYQLDQSISVLRVVRCFFSLFFQFSIEHSDGKQTEENLIRGRILRRQIWYCTTCLCPIKKRLGLYILRYATDIRFARRTIYKLYVLLFCTINYSQIMQICATLSYWPYQEKSKFCCMRTMNFEGADPDAQ